MSTVVAVSGAFMNFSKGGFFFPLLFMSFFYNSELMNPDESLTTQLKNNDVPTHNRDRESERESKT